MEVVWGKVRPYRVPSIKRKSMLDWSLVHLALSFLEKPQDAVCIQVPTAAYVQQVVDYLLRRPGEHFAVHLNAVRTDKGTVYVEACDTGVAGTEHQCPTFMVPGVQGIRGSIDGEDPWVTCGGGETLS